MSNNRTKSVRFAAGAEGGGRGPYDDDDRPKKRPRRDEDDLMDDDNLDEEDDDDIYDTTTSKIQSKNKKNKKDRDRINQDEMDDVDDWSDDEEKIEGVASERERLEAKRTRREQRELGASSGGGSNNKRSSDDVGRGGDKTKINDTTSLATEGIEIEPFHMKNERTDGTGYFDGDTYVFRKRNADEEPDAWLESLNENDDNDGKGGKSSSGRSSFFTESSSDSEPEVSKTEVRTREEWYAIIIPLLSKGNETIMQAVVRYGQLLKRQPLNNKRNRKNNKSNNSNNNKQESAAASSSSSSAAAKDNNNTQSESFTFAQKSLNEITGAANALLGLGDVDIYQKTKNDLEKLVPQQQKEEEDTTTISNRSSEQQKRKPSSSSSFWEYKGNQDGQIHGPYSGEQMKAWVGAGYFLGTQAVQIRSLKEKEKSNVDDLLSDLMDDDDDDGGGDDRKEKEIEYIRGEWQSSDKVDYDAAP